MHQAAARDYMCLHVSHDERRKKMLGRVFMLVVLSKCMHVLDRSCPLDQSQGHTQLFACMTQDAMEAKRNQLYLGRYLVVTCFRATH